MSDDLLVRTTMEVSKMQASIRDLEAQLAVEKARWTVALDALHTILREFDGNSAEEYEEFCQDVNDWFNDNIDRLAPVDCVRVVVGIVAEPHVVLIPEDDMTPGVKVRIVEVKYE